MTYPYTQNDTLRLTLASIDCAHGLIAAPVTTERLRNTLRTCGESTALVEIEVCGNDIDVCLGVPQGKLHLRKSCLRTNIDHLKLSMY